ncbi:MAG: hypothetical protein KDM91_05240 [Verrucomicrobiae bacterium]|nr:hypothetical protein [Verrucomicrobiae bacterium]MCP5549662.1 hypothetical protein [Akkermansiaceae bacterium]
MRAFSPKRLFRRSPRLVSALAAGLGLLLPVAPARAEIEKWVNRDGNELYASLEGYNLATRTVTLKTVTAEDHQYPLKSLSYESKLRVLRSPVFRDSLKAQKYYPPRDFQIQMGIFGLVMLIVVGVLIGLPCFGITARLATHRKGFRLHFMAWLKLIGSAIGLFLVNILMNVGFALGTNEAYSTGYYAQSCCGCLFFVASIYLFLLVLNSHYDIGFFKSYIVLLASGVLTILVYGGLVAYGAHWAANHVEQVERALEPVLDRWILEPMGLV